MVLSLLATAPTELEVIKMLDKSQIFWLILIALLANVTLSLIKALQERSAQRKSNDFQTSYIEKMDMLIELSYRKVCNYVDKPTAVKLVEVNYTSFKHEIIMRMTKIYINNHRDDPERQKDIKKILENTIITNYNSHVFNLRMLRYHKYTLETHLINTFKPELLIDGLYKRVVNPASTMEQTLDAVSELFDKFLIEHQTYIQKLPD